MFERAYGEHYKLVDSQGKYLSIEEALDFTIDIAEIEKNKSSDTAIDFPDLILPVVPFCEPILPYKPILRLVDELGSDTLQSPDDIEATFRSKRKESYQGYLVDAAETCHPNNDLNLVTQIVVTTNNKDDATVLEENVDALKQRTPDLDEMHVDGGYGSEAVDKKMEEHGITLVQTAVKGRTAKVPFEITSTAVPQEQEQEQEYTVTCPNPEHPPVQARSTGKHFAADFDTKVCDNCPFKEDCPTQKKRNEKKEKATFRFTHADVLKQKRHKAIQKIPDERKTLRPGVEPLMGLMHRGEKHTAKLKVRGRFNFELHAFAMGIIVNFERIFRFKRAKNAAFSTFCQYLTLWWLSTRKSYFNPNIICENISYISKVKS